VHEVFEAVLAAQRAGRGVYVLVTEVHGHTPQGAGARMFVRGDGTIVGTIGGGAVEREVVAQALALPEGGAPKKVSFKLKAELAMCCGGSMEVYMEPVGAPPRVWLFGAGHIAQPTAALAAKVGLRVTVIDERPEWNQPERFPSAERVLGAPLVELERLGPLGPRDYVLICTHDHAVDRALLAHALRTEAGYVGMIGSVRKVRTAQRALELDGFDAARIQSVHAPIGLDLCAETPDEIAVSIVAELIRHRRAPGSGKQTRGATVEPMRARLGDEQTPR
jgi:xanthine dehydrogenase accessory factor